MRTHRSSRGRAPSSLVPLGVTRSALRPSDLPLVIWGSYQRRVVWIAIMIYFVDFVCFEDNEWCVAVADEVLAKPGCFSRTRKA